MSQPDYISRNVDNWSQYAADYVDAARRNWGTDAVSWGIWGIAEADAGILPDVTGLDVVEFGCGTGYVSAWLARRGARPIGIDPTRPQLNTAVAMQQEFGPVFPLVQAIGERAPFRDGSFDLVISEYGSAIWSDPYSWIPEAARLLRRDGQLIFLGNSALLMLCVSEDEHEPAGRELLRPYFGMHRWEWEDTNDIEFHIPHGEWIRLLRANGFVIEDLIELQPPENATTTYEFVDLEWARQWPTEEVWKARKPD